MDVARQSQELPTKGGPLPGLLRPPVIFLVAILVGVALNRAWPVGFMPQGLCWLGGPGFSLRGTAFSAIAAGIPGSRHFRAGKRAQHEDREDGSLPLHSQSYLFGFHSVRGGIVSVVE